MPHDGRLTEHAIRSLAVELIRKSGPNHAARALGLNRITVLSLAAGARVVPATLALVREHLATAPP